MPRRKRVEIPGFHHIYNKSIDTKEVLKENNDKNKFLKILEEVSKQYNMKIHSYCITSTSYHLLIENTSPNLSLAMKQLNSIYSMFYNKKYDRSGTLWQDRFKSWYISNFKYLLLIHKYIESTPICEDLACEMGEYEYSSSFNILNNTIFDLLKDSFILKRFTKTELIDYFNTPLTQEEELSIQEFRKQKIPTEKEETTKQNISSLYYIFKDVTSKEQRNHKIYYAFKKGYKQSEISNYLNLSDSSISKIILKNRNS